MRHILPLLLLFPLCSLAAQDLNVPQETDVYNFVIASVDAPEGATSVWDVLGPLPETMTREQFNRVRSLIFVDYLNIEGGKGNKIAFTGPPGRYVLRLRIFEIVDGRINISLTKTAETFIVGEGPGPSPGPNPPTDPPTDPNPPTSFIDQVKQWTREVNDPENAKALAIIYSQVSDSLKSGDLSIQQGFEAVRLATDSILNLTGRKAKWEGWRGKVGDHLTQLQQRGQLSTPEQLAAVYDQVKTGLAQSSSASLSLRVESNVVSVIQTQIQRAKR